MPPLTDTTPNWSRDSEDANDEAGEFDSLGILAAVYGDKLLVVYGKKVIFFDTRTHEWGDFTTDMTEVSRSYSNLCMVVYKDKLYVVGGNDEESNAVKTVEVYDIETKTWSTLGEDMIHARMAHACLLHKDKLCVPKAASVALCLASVWLF
jgi:hypothetical protein